MKLTDLHTTSSSLYSVPDFLKCRSLNESSDPRNELDPKSAFFAFSSERVLMSTPSMLKLSGERPASMSAMAMVYGSSPVRTWDAKHPEFSAGMLWPPCIYRMFLKQSERLAIAEKPGFGNDHGIDQQLQFVCLPQPSS